MSDCNDDTPAGDESLPRKGAQQVAERAARAERVAAALRANLLKRKQQARERAEGD